MSIHAHICSLGHHVPQRVLTNAEIASRVDTSDEWIRTRTGIMERRIAEEGTRSSALALLAAQKALLGAGLTASDLTHIIVSSTTADAMCPNTAARLQEGLGASGGMVMDFNAACCGFVYGLELANGLLCAKPHSKILLAASEVFSHRVNWQDRSTCVLFGDGAGAAVLTAPQKRPVAPASPYAVNAALEAVRCESNSALANLLLCEGGFSADPYKIGQTVGPEYFITMQGREVFKHAVRSMASVCQAILEEQRLTLDDIDLFIPHQANMRIIEAVAARLNFPRERVFTNVDKYGNTSSASLAIALGEALAEKRIKPGMRVLLTTFGAGLTWAAALLHFQ